MFPIAVRTLARFYNKDLFQKAGLEPSPSASPRQVCETMAIFVADGDFYATTLANKLGINTSGTWIRAGLAPYNTDYEVDAFIDATRAWYGCETIAQPGARVHPDLIRFATSAPEGPGIAAIPTRVVSVQHAPTATAVCSLPRSATRVRLSQWRRVSC